MVRFVDKGKQAWPCDGHTHARPFPVPISAVDIHTPDPARPPRFPYNYTT